MPRKGYVPSAEHKERNAEGVRRSYQRRAELIEAQQAEIERLRGEVARLEARLAAAMGPGPATAYTRPTAPRSDAERVQPTLDFLAAHGTRVMGL